MTDKDTTYRDLIAKYLAKEISTEEDARLRQWLNEDAVNRQFFAEAESLWKLSGKKLSLSDTGVEQEWQRLVKSIENDKARPSLGVRVIPLYWKIAASVIIVIGLGYFVSLNWPAGQPETRQYTVYQTGDNDSVFYLPDNSRIKLEANSRLTFASSFEERTVRFEGAGFFEVQHDSLHMFSVNAGSTLIQVLGTSFSLRAYDNTDSIELILVSGRVKFSSNSGTEVIISQGEKSIYRKKDDSFTVEAIEQKSDSGKLSDHGEGDVPAKAQETENDKRNSEEEDEEKENARSPEELAMERERMFPAEYLSHTFTWKKNLLNQTIIEGTVTNTARYTAYTNIQLKVKMVTSNGQAVERETSILGLKKIDPGVTLPFKFSLTDAVQDDNAPVIEITGAKITQ